MININNLQDQKYYLFNEHNINESIELAKKLPETNLKNSIHFYWRTPREFSRKQVLPIKSAIVNNKNNSEIFLWSNVDLSNNIYLQDLLPYINLKIWNPLEEIKNSFLVDKIDYFIENKIDDEKCWLGGDLFRLLCLYKYGGIYIDMDMIILKNLSALFSYNFLYQWGSIYGDGKTTGIDNELFINGAIMAFEKEHVFLKKALEQITKEPPSQNTTCWGRDLYIKVVDYKEVNIFPCAWFNTEWCYPKFSPPFKKNENSNNLFDGAFTWHWHNKWDEEIENDSKFNILEKIINKKFLKIKYKIGD